MNILIKLATFNTTSLLILQLIIDKKGKRLFIVHILNNQHKQDQFNLLRKIEKNPNTNQRILAKDLGLSLGKLNYCLHSLKKKGLIKINNFSKNKKKLNYLYLLTPKGILTKSKLTYRFLKLKAKEYVELQNELEKK